MKAMGRQHLISLRVSGSFLHRYLSQGRGLGPSRLVLPRKELEDRPYRPANTATQSHSPKNRYFNIQKQQ